MMKKRTRDVCSKRLLPTLTVASIGLPVEKQAHVAAEAYMAERMKSLPVKLALEYLALRSRTLTAMYAGGNARISGETPRQKP